MNTDYSIGGWVKTQSGLKCMRVTLTAILAEYDHLGIAIPKYVSDFAKNGMRYSHEDFDVLRSAMHELGLEAWERIGTVSA